MVNFDCHKVEEKTKLTYFFEVLKTNSSFESIKTMTLFDKMYGTINIYFFRLVYFDISSRR